MSDKGYTHIYFGDGKGKTTAALGLALRAAGHGKKVVIVQFLKSWDCGELHSLDAVENIKVIREMPGKTSFVRDMSEEEKQQTKNAHDGSLRQALDEVDAGRCNLLILDEAIDAYGLGSLDESILFELIENKPFALELVLTGHGKNVRMIESADYVMEVTKVKHPYDKGILARKGIEW